MIWSATTGVASGGHIVLVHGALHSSAGLLKLSRRLDGRYLVTRFDRRGDGRSSPHDGPFGIDGQVDDLISVIDGAASSLPPRVLFGHSYGGNVALALASRRPDLVAGVVTYETPLSWLPWWPSTTGVDAGDAWHADPATAAERFMRRLIGDARWDRLPPATRAARRAEGVAMVGELIDLERGAPWHAEQVRVPVLALHGGLGREHHREAARTIARQVADGVCAAVDGASHAGPNTHPDETAASIDRFVRERVGRGPA